MSTSRTKKQVTQTQRADGEVVDIDKNLVRYHISPVTPDSYRTSFAALGWDLREYEDNPVVLWSHQRHDPDSAVGTGESMEVTKNGLFGYARFHRQTELSEKVFGLVESKVIRAVSHRFDPQDMVWYDEERKYDMLDEVQRAQMEEGLIDIAFTKQKLREFGPCLLGSNPQALSQLKRALQDGQIDETFLERSLTAAQFGEVMAKNKRSLAKVLRDARKAKGMTVRELAADLPIGARAYEDVENGRAVLAVELVPDVSAALELEQDDLRSLIEDDSNTVEMRMSRVEAACERIEGLVKGLRVPEPAEAPVAPSEESQEDSQERDLAAELDELRKFVVQLDEDVDMLYEAVGEELGLEPASEDDDE